MPDTISTMEWTGERMVPEAAPAATFWEHVYRYRFATRFVRGRRVLDIACGEGYGAHALARAGAAGVVGVDISAEACRHATAKYGLKTRVGDALAIPCADGEMDVIVSFETIEHVTAPDRFVAECARTLSGNGRLVISTPNRDVYSEKGQHNSYHCSEMNRVEFESILKVRFASVKLFAQVIRSAPLLSLDTFAAASSPWRRVRGYKRVRQWCLPAPLANPAMLSAREREDPARYILARDGMLANLFNPYAVRSLRESTAAHATYFVAVCSGPRS